MGKSTPRRVSQQVAHATAAAPASAAGWQLVLGLFFLLFSAVMTFLLVLEEISGVYLPGCGEGGPCEQAADSIWGKVPLVDWPVAFLGLAYFVGALAAWIAARGALPTLFRYLVRLGALGSLFFCVIIVVEWLVCPYCLAAHGGNFAFWATMEFTRARARRLGATIVSFGLLWLLTSVAVGVWDWQERTAAAEQAELERSQAVQRMIQRAQEPSATPSQPAKTPPEIVAVDDTNAAETAATLPAPTDEPPRASAAPFTGRYRYGPEQAPIRIVMITDYQCRDCRRVEQEMFQILDRRDDVSLSIKHFPFNPDCNPNVSRTLHGNACWAARAAEAAGMLWGDEGFFRMHRWLFERRGAFRTTRELEDAIRSFGYDPAGFVGVMTGDEVLQRIQAEANEAHELGLYFTPMIFVNGVELKGWHAPRALTRTVEELAAADLPALTAAADHPPAALEKYVADWQDWKPVGERPFEMPADQAPWRRGPQDAAVRIVLWGDYQETGTVTVDKVIREFAGGRDDVSYSFRHYPFNSDCNANLPYQRHPLACRASQAAEAAGLLGGLDAFWRMHVWLMDNSELPWQAAARQTGRDVETLRGAICKMKEEDRQKAAAEVGIDVRAALQTMNRAFEEGLRKAAGEMGLAADALIDALDRPEVRANITDDIEAGKRLPTLRWGTRPGLHGIPAVFINDKYVPRWRLEEDVVLDKILKAAVGE